MCLDLNKQKPKNNSSLPWNKSIENSHKVAVLEATEGRTLNGRWHELHL
jgi:hypothetical protein